MQSSLPLKGISNTLSKRRTTHREWSVGVYTNLIALLRDAIQLSKSTVVPVPKRKKRQRKKLMLYK
jgi:hypothetical protein